MKFKVWNFFKISHAAPVLVLFFLISDFIQILSHQKDSSGTQIPFINPLLNKTTIQTKNPHQKAINLWPTLLKDHQNTSKNINYKIFIISKTSVAKSNRIQRIFQLSKNQIRHQGASKHKAKIKNQYRMTDTKKKGKIRPKLICHRVRFVYKRLKEEIMKLGRINN